MSLDSFSPGYDQAAREAQMSSSPFISVVVPTHNRPEMLAEALASVRAQTFTDYEIIAVSNGESDDVRRASHESATAYDARYFTLPDGNASVARNFGIEHANGEWIALLDDDDLWLPNKLERQIAEAERTGADMVTCDFVEFFQDGREFIRRHRCPEGWPYVKAISHFRWFAATGATLIRKHVIDEVGGFDPRQRYNEDNDLWRRISRRHTIHQMDDVLMRYRKGHPSLLQDLERDERILNRYLLRYYLKMRLDTPRDLRWALPSVATFVLPRLATIYGPGWLSRLRARLRLRTRWMEFRRWLRARFAVIDALLPLLWLATCTV